MFVAEAWLSPAERLAQYVRSNELHSAFNFDVLRCPWDAKDLREVIDHTTENLWAVGAPATWVLSNHDTIRHRTRYGRDQQAALEGAGVVPTDLELGRRRARAAALLELALPGGAYIYQGDELGLPEVEDLPEDVLDDPTWERSGHTVRGRDGCRVPIPWSAREPPFGFGPGNGQPWLPQPADWVRTDRRGAGSRLRTATSTSTRPPCESAATTRPSAKAVSAGTRTPLPASSPSPAPRLPVRGQPRRHPRRPPHPPNGSCSPASHSPTVCCQPTQPPGLSSECAVRRHNCPVTECVY